MGFSISWLGVKLDKRSALGHLNLRDTGIEDEANEAPLSSAETGNGWTIVWSNDLRFAGDENKFAQLSKISPVILCIVEEHTMYSLAMALQDGEVTWSMFHQGDGDDVYHIEKAGNLPEFVVDIESEMIALRQSEVGRAAQVDYIFDIPLLAARRLSGFKHDEVGPPFTVVEPV